MISPHFRWLDWGGSTTLDQNFQRYERMDEMEHARDGRMITRYEPWN
jgi:hypothetical protein